jgi:Ca-activated chloride channel family protein
MKAVSLDLRPAGLRTGALLSIALVALTAAPVAAQAPVDEARPRFRSSADLVSIQTSVRDRRGRPLGGLTPADFEVRDNGQIRPVLSLRSDLRSPVSLAVLLDLSGSMSGSKMAMARQVYGGILAQLRDGEDEVGLFTFDSALEERQGFTSDLARLSGALNDFQPFGSTSLFDATAATARRLAGRSSARKAIIILTDGVDTSSRLTPPEVSGLASSIDVPVFVVATMAAVDQDARIASASRSAANADLRDLAEWTGGRMLFANTFLSTAAAAASLVDELRQQYVLAIEAANVNEWRRLEVRVVKDPNVTVKARSGYFGG